MKKEDLEKDIPESLAKIHNADNQMQKDEAYHKLIQHFKSAQESKDVEIILQAFSVLVKEKRRYAIKEGEEEKIVEEITEVEFALDTLSQISSPSTYRRLVATETKKTAKGYPIDPVLDFVYKHKNRIKDEFKDVVSDAHRGYLNLQNSCLSTLEKEHNKLQEKALGIERKSKKKERGLEM